MLTTSSLIWPSSRTTSSPPAPRTSSRGLDYARRAGDRAASQLAYEEAVRLYEMALTLARPTTRRRCELTARARRRPGEGGRLARGSSRSVLRRPRTAPRRSGWSEHLARAALGYGGRLIWEVSQGRRPSRSAARAGVGRAGGRGQPVASQAAGRAWPPARCETRISRRARRQSADRAGGRDGTAIGDPARWRTHSRGTASRTTRPTSPRPDRPRHGVPRHGPEGGDLERAAEAYEIRGSYSLELGDLGAARADFASMAARRELSQPTHDWFVVAYEALMALLEGSLRRLRG